MPRFQMPRSFYIPKHSTKVADKASDAVAYVYTSSLGHSCAAVFAGKQAKPVWHHRFATEARREATVMNFFDSCREAMARKVARRAERTSFAHSCKVGDIYSTCWGYDQTNVEFFEIVEIKSKFAILREIASASESDGIGSEKCVPQSGAYLAPRFEGDDRGLPIRRLIQDRYIKIDDVRWASPWGQRVAGVVVGKPAHRTAAGYGH